AGACHRLVARVPGVGPASGERPTVEAEGDRSLLRLALVGPGVVQPDTAGSGADRAVDGDSAATPACGSCSVLVARRVPALALRASRGIIAVSFRAGREEMPRQGGRSQGRLASGPVLVSIGAPYRATPAGPDGLRSGMTLVCRRYQVLLAPKSARCFLVKQDSAASTFPRRRG